MHEREVVSLGGATEGKGSLQTAIGPARSTENDIETIVRTVFASQAALARCGSGDEDQLVSWRGESAPTKL